MRRRLIALGGASLAIVVAIACTGENPDLDPPADGAAPTPDVVTADTTAPDGAFDPGPPHPSCPHLVTGQLCAAEPDVGAPRLHLDACRLRMQEGQYSSWKIVNGAAVLTHDYGTPPRTGGLFCHQGLNNRPAFVFSRDARTGFGLVGASADVVLGSMAVYTIIVVMRYEPPQPTHQTPGMLVFQRVDTVYPYRGPAISANHAWEAQPPGSHGLVETRNFSGSLSFGPEFAPDAGIAAVTPSSVGGPFVATVVRSQSALTVYVNGTQAAQIDITGSSINGAGFDLRVGHTLGDDKNGLTGAIGEMLVYDDATVDRLPLSRALMTKWGIQ
jgi:hypothetical protein